MGARQGNAALPRPAGDTGNRTPAVVSAYTPGEQAPGLAHSGPRPTPYQRYGKRAVDIVGSAILLVLTAPLMLVVAVGVLVTLGSPVIFRQARLTRGGRRFVMYKFRSMLPESAVADDVAGASEFHAADDSLRHTPVGRLIRRSALDELPQLWNVLKGDMSLVGPRPELPEVAESFHLVDHPRHSVRSGMTGAWQVSENRDGFVHLNVHMDEEYVRGLTFRRDATIALRTFVVLLGRVRPDRGTGEGDDAAGPPVLHADWIRDDVAAAPVVRPATGMRVLHVFEPRLAGVPAYVDALGRALSDRGVEQHVLAAADTSPDAQSWMFDAWADSVTERRWRRRPLDAYRIAGEIRRLVDSKGIDLVHAHATFAGIAARVRDLDVPLIYQPHGWGHLSARTPAGGRAVRLVERVLDPRTGLLLTLSRHEERDAPPGRSGTRVRPVVDLTGYRPLDDRERQRIRAGLGWAARERVHLCVGELSHRKNQVALARCWRERAPEGHRLVLVGDGRERARVEEAGGGRVDVVGWCSDTAALMGAADTLVVASRGEGFSLVILEALATGLPVFTTDVGGSEAVSPDAGVVCDSVDRVVAAATSSTLPDRPTAERACLARSIHAEWSVGSAADDFVAIFESARVHAVREAPHVRARVGVRRPVVSTGAGVVSGTREHDRLTLAERD